MTTNMQAGNLSSRDNASRDHAFAPGILATPTTVSKTPRVRYKRCVSALTTFIFKTKLGNDILLGRSERYNRYTL